MSFTYLFYSNLIFRKSCYSCPYTNTKRPSDITLGDFWGWEKTNPTANTDDKGISLILCNTEKGKMLFDAIKDDLDCFSVELKDCMQTRMEFPTPSNPNRDQFEIEYSEKGFAYVFKKYIPKQLSLTNRIIGKIKKICKMFLRRK
jgi:hypothetical protein